MLMGFARERSFKPSASSSSCGQAILYADNLTDSMAKATEETERRQFSWNTTRTGHAAADSQKIYQLNSIFPEVAAAECSIGDSL